MTDKTNDVPVTPIDDLTQRVACRLRQSGLYRDSDLADELENAARYRLTSQQQGQGEPVAIPREPTEAMMNAGLYHCSHDMTHSDLMTAWKAMFDTMTLDGGMTQSAPTAPQPDRDGVLREALERIADKIGQLWECDSLESVVMIGKECCEIFERSGMVNDGDGYEFAEDTPPLRNAHGDLRALYKFGGTSEHTKGWNAALDAAIEALATTTDQSAQSDAVGWRYSINYGPDDEENYANVYDNQGALVGNLRTHHAIAIVTAIRNTTDTESGS